MALIFGHRGASGYAPENTLEAFALAMEMGADGFELDVHLSKDGELIVIHDETVDRTTNGTGRIMDLTFDEIKQLDASNHIPGYENVRIPTLGEVYDLVRDTTHMINVEIKTDNIFYPGLLQKCLALEIEKGMQGRIIYSSFNHYTMMELKQVSPHSKAGLLYEAIIPDPWHYAKLLGADFVHPSVANVFVPDLVKNTLENSIGVNLWTVNDPDAMRECLKYDMGIITNYPDIAVSMRNTSK